MNKKMCPFLVIANNIGAQATLCLENVCALWNDHLGCCGLIATGIVQGIEIARQEMHDDGDVRDYAAEQEFDRWARNETPAESVETATETENDCPF